MPEKYALPPFLSGVVTHGAYRRWLSRKAIAHVKRDKRRGNSAAINEAYKMAVHIAVMNSGGHDCYTGEKLDWSLVSKYDNTASKLAKRRYKAKFALLPTVDHVGDGTGIPQFEICAWRTNDAKSDLSHAEFLALCRRVVAHFDRLIS